MKIILQSILILLYCIHQTKENQMKLVSITQSLNFRLTNGVEITVSHDEHSPNALRIKMGSHGAEVVIDAYDVECEHPSASLPSVLIYGTDDDTEGCPVKIRLDGAAGSVVVEHDDNKRLVVEA